MRLSITDRIARGAFADIFAPAPGARAIKLFRRIDHPDFAREAPLMFRDECSAYEIATRNPLLSRHVPAYFGTIVVKEVRGVGGEDLSDGYWLDLGYILERLPLDPNERKLRDLYNTPDWAKVARIEEAFEAADIRSLGDASVLFWRDGRPIFIDFGVSGCATHLDDSFPAP